MKKSTRLCYWKRDEHAEREIIELSEEDAKIIEGFKAWWGEVGETLTNEYYKIEKEDEEGNVVLNDVDGFYELQKEDIEPENQDKEELKESEEDIYLESFEKLREEAKKIEEEKKKEEEELSWEEVEKMVSYDDDDDSDDDGDDDEFDY